MDKSLKQRMIGAVVLIALAVVFIPMLLDGGREAGTETVPLEIPAPPETDFRSRLLPLDGTQEESGAEAESANGAIHRPAPLQMESRPAPADSAQSASPDTPARDEPEPATVEGEPEAATPEQPATETPPQNVQADAATGQSAALANWFVQVGSFAEQSNAVALRDRLRAAGYTTFVEGVSVGGEQTHRVIVGPEMDEPRAEQTRDEIMAEFGLQGIVVEQ